MNFFKLLRHLQRPLSSQKGSSTVQYIIIIAVGVLLASILFLFMNDSLIQTKVEDKVTQALDGKTTPPVSGPNSEDSNEQMNGNNPTNDPKSPNPNTTPPNPSADQDKKDEGFFDWLGRKVDEGTKWVSDAWDQGTKWVSDAWNGSVDWLEDQWNRIWENDLKRAWNDPLGYLGDMVGWDDITETWDKITSDPLGYLEDSWNVIKDGWNAAWEDPLGTLGTLIFDKDQFMQGWNGKDENGEHIPFVNRIWKMAESLPLPTKVLKVGSAGKKILVHDGCGCGTGNNTPSKSSKDESRSKNGRIVDEYGNAIPHGFSSLDEYYKFTDTLKKELPEGTQILFQGSSVTGKSHKTGKPFDDGRVSDFDIALINDDLFIQGLEGEFRMKTDPNRMGPMDEKQLEKLGLLSVQEKMSKIAGRDVNFMLYESVEEALRRPSIMVIK